MATSNGDNEDRFDRFFTAGVSAVNAGQYLSVVSTIVLVVGIFSLVGAAFAGLMAWEPVCSGCSSREFVGWPYMIAGLSGFVSAFYMAALGWAIAARVTLAGREAFAGDVDQN